MKANRKVSAFERIANYIDFQKGILLYKSVNASTFKYCPLIWMFCGQIANDNRIDNTQTGTYNTT